MDRKDAGKHRSPAGSVGLIFITGCARSGTSLTTKILQKLGCNLGEVNSLYENLQIREGILKPYFRSIGADPLGQRNLPDTNNLPLAQGLKERVLACIPGKEPRAYKDAKLTLVWPVWAAAFPEAKWVIVRRDRERIVDSCLNTSFMFSYRERDPWRAWVIKHEMRFEDMRALDFIEIWPDHYVDDPEAFSPVAKFCGLEFWPEVVAAAVNHEVWTKSVASV